MTNQELISRQAVLDLIEHYNSDGLGSVFYGYEEGVKFADAVNKLPSVNPQEPKYCDRNICVSNEYNGIGCDECEVTKSQEPNEGHWIKHDTSRGYYYDCSLCGCLAPCTETADSFLWKLSKFCPDCGAKMEEGSEE